MGQILVRNLDDAVIERLKAKAAAGSTSLEQTVRDILTKSSLPDEDAIWDEIERSLEGMAHSDLDIEALIREDRDRR